MPYFTVNVIIIAIAMAFSAGSTSRTPCLHAVNVNDEGLITVRKDFIFAVLAALVLIIFMGFRNNFSTDYDGYISIFRSTIKRDLTIKDLSIYAKFEPAFIILNKIIGLVSDNSIFFMTVTAAIIVWLTVYEAYYETTNIFWFMLLYFNTGTYLMTFNALRQGLAASIAYYGTKFLRKGDKKRFLFVILLAVYVHRSAIFILAISPFLLMEVNRKNIFAAALSGLIIFILIGQIMNTIQNYFSVYRHYKSESSGENIATVITQWVMFLFCCMAVKMKKLDVKSITGRILFNGSLFFVIGSILSLKFYLCVRLKYFTSMYLIAFTSNAINAILSGKSKTALRFLLTLLIFAYLYARLMHGTYGDYVFLG